ncbi:MAG: 5'/3'-nucleotidase SurE [Hyphomicrobiaceae bacterium]
MRILVTNDDGIDAPGLHALRQIAEELAGPDGEVWVSAPETNQSGTGNSLSLNEPLRMRQMAERVYAVRGTPTDSVIMAARHVLKGRLPDLVLSGINRGANLAEDVTYSGTIAGAFEGTQLGIPSIALSMAYSYTAGDHPHWQTPLSRAPALIRQLISEPWPPLVLMSINFPDRLPDEIEGVMVTTQGRRDQQNLGVEERSDTWGNPYYWLGYQIRRSNPPRGTDLWAVYNGWISVTPLSLNLTDRAMHAHLTERLGR